MTLRSSFACALVLVFATVAGCASSNYRSVQPGVVTVGKMRVTLGSGWQRAPDAETPEKLALSRILSRDGLENDRLILIAGITDGEAIFRVQAITGLPTFQTEMDLSKIADLVADSLQAALWDGSAIIKASNIRAHGFAGTSGFKFELEADVPGAADHRGIAGGFVDDGRLYVNIFLAESPESYERHLQTAQQVIDSAVLAVKTIRMSAVASTGAL